MADKTDKVRYSINGGPLKMAADIDEATAAVLKVIADYHLDFITTYKILDDTTVELELIVSNGDAVIIGTITDFMQPEIEDMLNTLENFNDLGVQIISRLEPDYEIKEYRKSIRLADRIARKRLGLKPV